MIVVPQMCFQKRMTSFVTGSGSMLLFDGESSVMSCFAVLCRIDEWSREHACLMAVSLSSGVM